MVGRKVHDVFQYPFVRKELGNDLIFNSIEDQILEFRKDFIKKSLSSFPIPSIEFPGKCQKSILIHEPKYFDLLSDSFYQLKIIGGFKSMKYSLRKGVPGLMSYYFLNKIYSLYYSDIKLETKGAKKLIRQVQNYLINSNFNFLVLNNDWLFLERFLIFCAREIGMKSICIQHGAFSSNSNILLLDGHYADYLFVWGQYFFQMYQNAKGFPDEKLKILGYPHNVLIKNESNLGKKLICILGQGWGGYHSKKNKEFLRIITNLIEILKLNNFDVVYKPHPSEKDLFLSEGVEVFYGDLDEAISKYNVFISLTSTALLDVTLKGKIAIQLYDEYFGGDRFEEIGFSYSLDIRCLNDIIDLIQSINSSYSVNQKKLKISNNIGKEFKILLNDIL